MPVATQAAAVTFDPVQHAYRYNDRKLGSVTEIMRVTGLLDTRWYGDDPQYRNRGKAVHTACALIDAGEYDEEGTHPIIRPYARQYLQFKADTGFQGKCWEIGMAHIPLGIAGTLDTVGTTGDDLWLVDIKTGVPPPMVGVQLAGYEQLVHEGVFMPDAESGAEPDNWLTRLLFNTKQRSGLFKLKSLYLPGKDALHGVLRSHDEQRWKTTWRAAVTVYNARKEAGLL